MTNPFRYDILLSERKRYKKGSKVMKKVIAIKDMFGKELPIEKMNIQFVGNNYVVANFKGFGFTKTYGVWDGYTVIIEKN